MSKLLLIDDDTSFAALLAKHLRTENFEVVVARNAKEGLSAIAKEKPDLVLLDMLLPDHFGVGVADLIQSKEKKIPVIMISGYGDSEFVVQAMKAGARDYVVKPIEYKELSKKINRYLEEGGAS